MRNSLLWGAMLSAAIFGAAFCETALGQTPSPVVPQTNASCLQGAQHSCCLDGEGFPTSHIVCDKTRFISFTPPTDSVGQTALRVNLVSLHRVVPPYGGSPSIPFTAFEGLSVYVGPPGTFVESTASGITFMSSQTQCQPHYQDWTTVGLLHVRGSAIVPSSTYQVEVLAPECMGVENSAECQTGGLLVSSPADLRTTRWGDVEVPFNPPSPTSQADLGDVSALVNKFRGARGAPIKARTMIQPNDPFGNITDAAMSQDVGFDHIAGALSGFRGWAYPAKMGQCALANTACTTSAECGANGPCNLYCP